jgi:molybdate transport system substrate-binding protein
MTLPARALIARCGAVVMLTAGCSGGSGSGESSASGGDLTVFAAASLQKTFTQLGDRFEQANPDTTVRFNFGGSSDLVAQLQQGAPADVLASADTATMDKAVADDLIAGEPEDFATNSLAIAVPAGNPGRVDSFAALSDPGLRVVVCAPQVPCGAATGQVEENTGVTLDPVSEESSVTDVLGKVMSGQADAGVVYVTDIAAAGDTVEGVAIAESDNAVNTYPIAVLADSANAALAARFEAYVMGPGQEVLAESGFGAPSS